MRKGYSKGSAAIDSPSLTPLPLHLLSLQNTCSVQALSLTFPNIDPLIYISMTDLCLSEGLPEGLQGR